MRIKYTIGLMITFLWFHFGITAQQLVKDINVGSGNSSPSNFITYNDKLFFVAKDNIAGNELWSLDKRFTNISMLKDIMPSAIDSNPDNFIVFNNKLFFSAEGVSGREIWVTDGTPTGTYILKNIAQHAQSSSPQNFTIYNGKLYFSATDGVHGRELWVTDGTSANTYIVKDIAMNAMSSSPTNFIVYDSKLYFTADDGSHGRELWVTDGTSSNTHIVKDVATNTSNASPTNLTIYNNKLYFTADDGVHGQELWVTDGSAIGTNMLKDINLYVASSSPSDLTVHENNLYFSAMHHLSGRELWVTDGTSVGTKIVRDIQVGAGSSNPTNLLSYYGNLYFSAKDLTTGRELWKTDGTVSTTKIVQDINVGAADSDPSDFIIYDGKLYFVAQGATQGIELWGTGGTANQTAYLSDLSLGSSNSSPSNFYVFKGRLYFTASDPVHGRELYHYTFSETPDIEMKQGRTTISNNTGKFDFGEIKEGDRSRSVTFTIENTRDFDLQIETFKINGVNAGDFTTVSTNFSNTIDGFTTATFTITFSPHSTGFKTAFLTIESNDPDEKSYTFTLTGKGLDASPRFSLNQNTTLISNHTTNAFNFAEVRTDATSPLVYFTIRNTGVRDLNLRDFQISGADTQHFTTVSWTTASITGQGGQTSFGLQFSPKTTGFKTAFITVRSNDPSKDPFTFSVIGRGVAPNIELLHHTTVTISHQGLYDFKTVRLTQSSPVVTFTVKNTGTADLKLKSFSISGSDIRDFVTTNLLTHEIASEGLTRYTVFTVKFKPDSLGFKTAFITIQSDDPDQSTYTFQMNGFCAGADIHVQTGSTELVSRTSTYDFGKMGIDFSKDVFITISNFGNDDLRLTGFTTTGSNSFATSSYPISMITAQGKTFMTVRFQPKVAGFHTVFMSITNNDLDETPYILRFTGEGVSPYPITKLKLANGTQVLNGGTYDFGAFDTALPSVTPTFMTIHNEGSANLFISSFSITKLDGTAFASTPFETVSFATAMVTISGGVGFKISFKPRDSNFVTALVSIQTNDPNINPYKIKLTGYGKAPEPDIHLTFNTTSILNGKTFDFGNVGFTTVARRFITVQNKGSANLTLSSLAFSGGDAVHFKTVTSWATTTLTTASPTTSFEVEFSPTALGMKTAFLKIGSNDPDENPYIIRLTGTGKGADIELNHQGKIIPSQTVLDLGKQDKKLNNTTFITVKNTGFNTLNLTSFAITGRDATFFSTVSSWSPFVSAGQHTAFELQFASAPSESFRVAFITIKSDVPNKPYHYFTVYATHVGQEIIVQNNFMTIPNKTGAYPFSNTSIGNNNPAFMTVENMGLSDLKLQYLTITGANASDFSTVTWGSSTLASRAKTGFTLKFSPSGSIGFKTAFITIYNDDTDRNPYTFSVYGVAKSSVPDIEVSRASFISSQTGVYDFGTVSISSAFQTAFITIKNTGAQTLNLSSFSITGSDAVMFQTAGWGSAMLTANQVTFLTVGFKPTSVGIKTATITIASNDPDTNPYTFKVMGTGNQPDIYLQIGSTEIANQTGRYDFGAFNTASSTEVFITIKNTGSAPLNLTSFTSSGTGSTMFSTTSWANSMITSGGMTFMSVKFQPTTPGFKTVFMTIGNDDPDENPYTFTLVGFGKNSDPDMNIYRGFISVPHQMGIVDFGTANVVQHETKSLSLEIKNTGIGNLELMTFSITGANASAFTTISWTTASVSVNGSTFFTVKFKPTTLGFQTAFIKIQSNDPDTNPYLFKVVGEGVVPDIQVRYMSSTLANGTGNFDFSQVSAALSRIVFITIENVGKANLNLQRVSITGANAVDFVTTPWHKSVLQHTNGHTAFAIKFEPKTAGNKTATVSIWSDDPDENPFTFQVKGVAKNPDIQLKYGVSELANHVGKYDFENVGIGFSQTLFMTITNTEATTLDLLNLRITGRDASMFKTVLWANSQVKGFGSTHFALTFKPSSIGFKTAFVTITSNDPDENPYTFSVVGIGENPAPNIHVKQGNTSLINHDTFQFDSINTASSNGNVAFEIENQGYNNLVIDEFKLVGLNANQFKIKKMPLSTIAGRTSSVFEIEFLPTSTGFKTAQIRVKNNAPHEQLYFVTIFGQGTKPPESKGAFTPKPDTTTIVPQPSGVYNMDVSMADEELLLQVEKRVTLTKRLKVGVPFKIISPVSQITLALPNMYYKVSEDQKTTTLTPTQAGTYELTLRNANYRKFKVLVTVEKGDQKLVTSEVKTIPSFPLTHIPFYLDLGLKNIGYKLIGGSDIAVLRNGKITPTGNQVGTVTLQVWKKETANYSKSNAINVSFEVVKGKPFMKFPAISDRTFTPNETFELEGISSSTQPILYIAKTSNISISGNMVKVLGAGLAKIEATLPSNNLYESASSLNQSFTIGKGTQTIRFDAISNKVMGDSPFTLNASTSSNLPIAFQVVEGQNLVSLSGSTITIKGAGKIKIRASQSGNANYLPASAVERSFEILPTLFLGKAIVNTSNYTLQLSFTSIGQFHKGNEFVIELSGGIDGSPVHYLKMSTVAGGTATAYIPERISQGSNHKIRIIASSPHLFSNGLSVYTTLYPKPTDPSITQTNNSLCATDSATAYQWYIRTNTGQWQVISGATNRCLNISTHNSGRIEGVTEYAVQTFHGNRGSNLSDPVRLGDDLSKVLATEKPDFIKTINLFPNPAKRQLFVQFDLQKPSPVIIQLLDKLGRKLADKKITIPSLQVNTQLDLAHLPKGIYFVHITTDEGVIVHKVVKE